MENGTGWLFPRYPLTHLEINDAAFQKGCIVWKTPKHLSAYSQSQTCSSTKHHQNTALSNGLHYHRVIMTRIHISWRLCSLLYLCVYLSLSFAQNQSITCYHSTTGFHPSSQQTRFMHTCKTRTQFTVLQKHQ